MSRLLTDIVEGQVWKARGSGKTMQVIATALQDFTMVHSVVWKGDSGQYWVTPMADFRARKMDLISSPPALEAPKAKAKKPTSKKKGK